jgi:hypothetical protein
MSQQILTQTTASNVWTFTNPFGTANIVCDAVIQVDGVNTEIQPNDILVSSSQIIVKWSTAQTGFVNVMD